MAICNSFLKEEDDKLVEAAQRGEFSGIKSCTPEQQAEFERMAPELEQSREDFQRAVEETGRQELAEEQSAKDEADPKYQQKLQENTELKISEDHQVLIKGFNASRINNEETARVQALLPAIVSQVTKVLEFTGELPPVEMDERGRLWATVENWNQEEGGATGKFHKQTAEMTFDKSEEDLSAHEKDLIAQQQMDTQLHWNFHTIHEILFTDDDRLEVERICIERSQSKPGWEKKVSDYAEERASEGRIDEVFCEFGRALMTDALTLSDSSEKETLRKLNPELYDFIKDRLERLNRLSETLGLEYRR